ncbi:hypothetical protein Scep_029586 [Stephania cephalantha]|uniref:Uncharacterized protein n=1 Tax=Stephania cephalantha TaxID=152367 RepID=A0AAP0HHS6_9MAGN
MYWQSLGGVQDVCAGHSADESTEDCEVHRALRGAAIDEGLGDRVVRRWGRARFGSRLEKMTMMEIKMKMRGILEGLGFRGLRFGDAIVGA